MQLPPFNSLKALALATLVGFNHMKYILSFLLCCSALAQQTVNNFTVKTNLTVSGAQAATKVNTVADLRALTPVQDGMLVQTSGYWTNGDGGGTTFYYSASSSASTNLGTVIAPLSGSGRFLWISNSDLNVKMFGAKGDSLNDDKIAIQSAWNNRSGRTLVFPKGRFAVSGTLWFTNSPSDKSFSICGEGISDNSASEIFSTSVTEPVTVFSGAGGSISRITIRYDGASRPSNTNCVAVKLLDVSNTTLFDISTKNAYIGFQHTAGYSQFSNQYFNCDVYGYSGIGWDISGVGTQNFFYGCDIRNTPVFPTGTATGVPSNVSTNVTISSVSSSFITNLIVGNLVIVSGLTPSEFNGIFTVTATNATSIEYQLAAPPSGPVSGTASLETYTGTATLYGIRQVGGNRSQWFGFNVEYVKAYSAIYADGIFGISGLSLEGFTGYDTSGYVIWLGQGADVDNLYFFNSTFPTNSTYRLFGASSGATINAGTVTTRDLWYAGTTLNWMAGGGKLVFGGQHYPESSARWNRTSYLSTPSPNSRLFRPESASAENIEFSISGSIDRRLILSGTSIYARDNATGLSERSLTIQAGNISSEFGVFTLGSTNTGYEFRPSTSNRRLIFSAGAINSVDNSTSLSPQTLSMQTSGGAVAIGSASSTTPLTVSGGSAGVPLMTFSRSGHTTMGIRVSQGFLFQDETNAKSLGRMSWNGSSPDLTIGNGFAASTVAANLWAERALGTDVAGSDLNVYSGQGTGSASTASSRTRFYTPTAGASGSSAQTMTERVRFDSTSDPTLLPVWINYNGTLKQVQVGAADSGGVGYRMLRITN